MFQTHSLLLLLALSANPSHSGELPKDLALTLSHRDGRVGTYVSSPDGFRTSSYWIEGPTGLIVIDTQFIPSGAEELFTYAEKMTGKKVKLAIVLHANPDKFNGTATFQKHGVKVITSDQVKALIPAVHKLRKEWFYDRWKPDYPEDAANPDSFGSKDTEVSAGGVTVKLHVMGAGCSEAHVVAEYDGHVFVGDLVANGAHSWLEIGKTDEWLKRLDEIQALDPTFVHPGRGDSGGPELLVREKAYLHKVIDLVAAAHPHLPFTEDDIKAVQDQVEQAYPGYGYTRFLTIGLPAEYRRQATLAQQGKPALPVEAPTPAAKPK
jgi:glyoxylase-like metal-dependent hydrolase (beta-lactamase superfamily II)